MSSRPSWKSVKIGLSRPFSAFFAFFRRVRSAPGKSRKRRKKAFFLRCPLIFLNPHLLSPHLRHSTKKIRNVHQVFHAYTGGANLRMCLSTYIEVGPPKTLVPPPSLLLSTQTQIRVAIRLLWMKSCCSHPLPENQLLLGAGAVALLGSNIIFTLIRAHTKGVMQPHAS